jgi:hypothetical protein
MTDAELIEANVKRITAGLHAHGWALHMVARFNGPVYLLGSVLHKPAPRDIDIRIVVPDSEFAARYGHTLVQTELDQYHPFRKERSMTTASIVRWDEDGPTQRWVDDMAKFGAHLSQRLNENVDLKAWPESYWRRPYPRPLVLAAPSSSWFIYNKYNPDPQQAAA